MSGEELKQKLEKAGISQAEISRKLGVIPQSVNQSLAAKDVKSGFIESLCRAFELDAGFFYGGATLLASDDLEKSNNKIKDLLDAVEKLQEENSRLKSEIIHLKNPDREKKESEVYRLWMKQMEITERMQELYQKQKEG
jgi:transcriptional regulator with XRE-family HTH domain